jgi:hypothetical protein
MDPFLFFHPDSHSPHQQGSIKTPANPWFEEIVKIQFIFLDAYLHTQILNQLRVFTFHDGQFQVVGSNKSGALMPQQLQHQGPGALVPIAGVGTF